MAWKQTSVWAAGVRISSEFEGFPTHRIGTQITPVRVQRTQRRAKMAPPRGTKRKSSAKPETLDLSGSRVRAPDPVDSMCCGVSYLQRTNQILKSWEVLNSRSSAALFVTMAHAVAACEERSPA